MERKDYDHSQLEGLDISIEISLQEYGLAWIETDTEYLFYYGIKGNDEGYYAFDFQTLPKNLDIKSEYDWADFEGVNNFVGGNFFLQPLPFQISDLLAYYGFENVFGSSYWEGLTYNDIVKAE